MRLLVRSCIGVSRFGQKKTVIARLDRATQYSRGLSATSRNLRIEINPVRIILFDQRNLPSPRPFLQALFAMDRLFDLVEALEIDQPRDVVVLCKALSDFQFVLAGMRSLVTPM